MGGIALGKGVTSSGLMVTMDGVIHRLLEGLSLYTVVLVLSPVVLVRDHVQWCFTIYSKRVLDRIDIYKSYNCKRAASSHRERGWTELTRRPCEPAHFYDWSSLFCWDGDACFWVS